jgi:LPXTG-motif cell wall-anchored protein
LKKEQEAVVKLKQQVEETPRPTSTQEATKEDAIIESTTIEAKVETKKDDKKNNTILYVGIGVVVLLGIVLVMRKK